MTTPLRVECPRCVVPIASDGGDGWSCPEHGEVDPLWRPSEASYDGFTAHLARAGTFPTYLPWPLGPGWSVADFAVVAGARPRATMTWVSGSTTLDGPVDVIVVSEEIGTGLGARLAGLDLGTAGGPATTLPVDSPLASPTDLPPRSESDALLGSDGGAGETIAAGPPEVKVRVEARTVGLWPVSTSRTAGEWDRSVLAGEAEGRWLWLVLRPASAILLLRDEWILRDVSLTGPHLVTLPFGGPPPSW